ncbi:hypothetical protein [Stackebrandtia nassauensis]|uniref:Uncharacterized protein n=1 Tax=Stackebrandtia nassauensis (strain DSM 44728 / CIP 108903 / NRRL B-16338 / NBRC 102104 / LLR-40K-21) TaxID=446470 RepID=D3Q392_STANL|nr:hypothetical protein [Stackebrandtia nassauensis]ADD40062.1 hypothetical protein Snas_0344 [Stackebrandtia nassauensis DSM 44728]
MKLLINTALFTVFTLAEAGLLKLVVYIAHTQWLPALPTIDYLTAVMVLTGINFLISTWRVGNKLGEAVNNA